ncbi:hypothetical protein BKH22_13475 [Actinomyces oris]|nr:hypothetical protein BKH22_13475 [Actinomyces oris]
MTDKASTPFITHARRHVADRRQLYFVSNKLRHVACGHFQRYAVNSCLLKVNESADHIWMLLTRAQERA